MTPMTDSEITFAADIYSLGCIMAHSVRDILIYCGLRVAAWPLNRAGDRQLGTYIGARNHGVRIIERIEP